MKFKAVVFDMDGVMFDTESVCMKSWDTVGEEMGIGKEDIWSIKHSV